MHSAKYDTGMLETIDLTGKVFMVTGANAGIGRCLSEYLARRGASLYMVCRNAERAEKALNEIKASTGNQKVSVLICDCSLGSSVRDMMADFAQRVPVLDGLVCNAGVMMPKKMLTSEGFEVTLATHLLHGSYLLTQLALPLLRRAAAPRVIFVSSGGMYNTPWPGWDVASAARGSYVQEMACTLMRHLEISRPRRVLRSSSRVGSTLAQLREIVSHGLRRLRQAWSGATSRGLGKGDAGYRLRLMPSWLGRHARC